MSARTTKTLTTPGNRTIVIKEYLTAGEFIDISDAKDNATISKAQMAKRIVDLAVVSIDGNTEDISGQLRDLPFSEYAYLNEEVAKLLKGDFTGAKAQ